MDDELYALPVPAPAATPVPLLIPPGCMDEERGLMISIDTSISTPRDPAPAPALSLEATSAPSHLLMLKCVKSFVSRVVPPANSDGQSRAIEHDATRL